MLNASPIANFDPSYTTPVGTPLSVVNINEGLLANDFDSEGSSLTASLLGGNPANGTVTVNSNGTFVYTPNPGFSGVDYFFYLANDGNSDSRFAQAEVAVGDGFSGRLNQEQRIQDNSLHSGGLTLVQDLADGMELIYRSDADGKAIVTVDAFLTPGTQLPDKISAKLTFGGNVTTINYDADNVVAGEPLRFSIQTAQTLSTGMYDWSMELTLVDSGGNSYFSQSFYGSQAVVNNLDSAFGTGWNLNKLDRLHLSDEGALLVEGDGTTLWFQKSGAIWFQARGDLSFSTLTESGGIHTLTDKWGNERRFDSNGLLVAVKEVNNTADMYTFTYESGLLSKVTDEFNRDFTFEYDNPDNLISECGSFSGDRHSEFNFGDDGLGNVTLTVVQNILDLPLALPPLDAYIAPEWTYVYDGIRCGTRTEPGMPTASTYEFDDFGLLNKINRPDGSTWHLSSTYAQGLVLVESTNPFPDVPKVADANAHIIDERGEVHFFKTDHYGNIVESTPADTGTSTNDVSPYGLLYQQTGADPDASLPQLAPVTKFGYNYFGDMLIVVNADNTTQKATYHPALHIPLSTTDELGKVTTYVPDAVGNIESTTDPDLNTWSFTWDSHGNMLTRTSPDPDGVLLPRQPLVTVYEYEDTIYNRLEKVTNADQTFREFVYSDADLVLSVTDEIGRETTYLWDPMDRLVQMKEPNAGQGIPTWTYDYLDKLLVSTVVDPLNNVTSYEYNNRYWLETITYPDPDGSGAANPLESPEEHFTYFPTGELQTASNPTYSNGLLDVYDYDGSGRLTSVSGPLPGQVQTYNYDLLGRLVESEDASGRIVETSYDIRNRVTSVEDHDPDGSIGPKIGPTVSYQYDLVGRLTHVTDPLNRITVYGYQDNGWLESITQPDPDDGGTATSPQTFFGYDALGWQTSITDPLGRITKFDLDEMGRTVKLIEPNPYGNTPDFETVYEYDDVGRLESVTDPLQIRTDYVWDDLDRLDQLKLPFPGGSGAQLRPIINYEYDNVGNLLKMTDARGNATDYEYDDLYRETLVTEPAPFGNSATSRPQWETVYGNDTLIESTIDALDRVTSYDYDEAGRLFTMTEPLNRTTTYEYDLLNRIELVTSPTPSGGTPSTTQYGYDIYSRLESTTDANSGQTLRTYDDAGQLLSLTDSVGNQTRWAYDDLGRVSMESNSLGKTSSYDYDSVGNLTRIGNRNGDALKFFYDDLDRPTFERWFEPPLGAISLTSETLTEGGSGSDEVQKVKISGSLNGTFRLAFNGETTRTLLSAAPLFRSKVRLKTWNLSTTFLLQSLPIHTRLRFLGILQTKMSNKFLARPDVLVMD